MVKSIFLSAFALLDLAAAATSSSSPSASITSMANASPSPTLSMFVAESSAAFELDNVNVSLVAIKQPLTTIAICLTSLEKDATCSSDVQQLYTLDASNTIEFNTQSSIEGLHYSNHAGCTIKPGLATCTGVASISGAGTSTTTTISQTYSGKDVTFIPVTITAGAEKLAQATEKPTHNGVPRITGVPNAALIGGAAFVGAAFAL
ncbi:uncharacterized protein GIQ15_04990 [Arthroderma uncinatum]|uniref:uncharacterized protein n=1 Tax=Arthroderma uncinatum TaxID=74035 RepID=UPI00144AA2F2|nr:uncharacterized protein GIQ15_04990 [Arthroderma uncinatum]KAF3482231.1 hypothetical protein GIQ15_04990 [Arthroderma uncinatum]